MSRSLSWSEELNGLLNATDGNVARIKVTEALRQTVQGLLEEREQQMYKISTMEASLRLLQRVPEGRVLLLEQCLEGLRSELQGLQSQVQELAQAHRKTRQGKCNTPGLHQNMQTERRLLWEELEVLWEELKLLWDQLSQHQELLLKQMAKGHQIQVQTHSWKMLEQLQSGQEAKSHTLKASRTEAWDVQQEHNLLRSEGPLFMSSNLNYPGHHLCYACFFI